MKQIKTTTENKNVRLWEKVRQTISITALLVVVITYGNVNSAFAQFTFMGDYDKSFAAPLGYYVDPEKPVNPTVNTYQTAFYTGELLADGSIIAGGLHNVFPAPADFYLRKFTATGAVDASFGTNGSVLTDFHAGNNGNYHSGDSLSVLKVQPDGKIVVAGACTGVINDNIGGGGFGDDVCVVRYNANGSIDTSFGGALLVYGNFNQGGQTFTTQIAPGRVVFQSGIKGNNTSSGTNGAFYDMAIQPDGKIVLVGETRDEIAPYVQGAATSRFTGIIVRLNPNGSRDATFGADGIARFVGTDTSTNPNDFGCWTPRRFYGVRLQPDGRIIAVGHDGVNNDGCFQANRFVVTRWTAGGQLETTRYLDNNTTYNDQRERATTAHFTRDGSKLIVAGSYDCKATLVRLNISDLSVDTSFGIRGYAQNCGVSTSPFGTTLYVKAIQPDGRIIGVDYGQSNYVRFNPDGSNDLSFGNQPAVGNQPGFGRLAISVTHYNGAVVPLEGGQVLVRPNGRINILGYSYAAIFQGVVRAVASQQNTTFKNGVYPDFTNDGKTDIGVFRPSTGAWFYLNSANNQSNGVAFGLGTDRIAPADYDGDGKTDVAVFRNGIWYLQQSTKGFTGISFGTAGDLPRPGDYDGDGLADICVFRPSTGIWYRLNSSNGQFVGAAFGQSGDVPLLADFDGDAKSDIAVFRQGFWYYLNSSNGAFQAVQFGASTDVPVVGDYDGDSKSDISVFRESNGVWYRINSSTGAFVFDQFGQAGDKPVPGDYDNDGRNDLAIFRNGVWYGLRSTDNSVFGVAYGASSDVPVPAAYLP